MRNLKKLLAVVVAICVLATFTLPAFAEGTLSADTKTCADIGVLVGSGAGVTAEYAATTPTRVQSLVMVLRLTGKLAEAQAFTGTENFADADTAAWAKPLMAFAKAHPELGFEGDGTNFMPGQLLTAQMYYKVLLTALGYAIPADYAYADTLTFAKDTVKLATVGNVDPFTVDSLATATVEGLKGAVKGGTTTLATTLVDASKLDKAAAIAAGLYSDAVTAAATATGAKILKVTFSKAIDTTKATFAIKKAGIAVNVATTAFNDAKTEATLTLASKMTAGDYAVTVGGLDLATTAYTVTVKDETVTKITLGSSILINRADAEFASVSYKVSNQYDEDMTSTVVVNVSAGKGTATPDASNGIIALDSAAADYTNTDKVAITVVHAGTGVYASALLNVSDKAQVADVAITQIYNANGKVLQVGTTEAFVLVIDAKDQYGNAMTDPANLTSDLLVSVSNPTVANVGAFATTSVSGTNKTTLAIAAGPYTAGTSTVRLISRTTGKMATFDVVVKEAVKADLITLSTPALAVAGEEFTVPFTAVDQFGVAVTDQATLAATTESVTGAAGISFDRDPVKGVTNLVVDATNMTAAGTAQVTIVTLTGKIASLTVNVQAPAKPTVISGLKDFNANLAKTNTATLAQANVIVKDQYGRDFTYVLGAATALLPNNVVLSIASSDTGKVTSGAAVFKAPADTSVITGVDKGTSTITLKLQKWTDANADTVIDAGEAVDIAGTDFTYTAKVVDKSDIVSYELAPIAKVYCGGAAYAQAVVVNGVLADGSKVTVPEAGYYTVNFLGDVAADYDATVTGKITATAAVVVDGTTNEATGTVIATVDGASAAQILTGTVTFTKAARAVTSLAIATSAPYTVEDDANYVVSALAANIDSQAEVNTAIAAILSAKDQYGVDYAAGIATTVNVITNITDNKLITAISSENTFNVTVITTNGKVLTIKFIVK